MKIAKISINIFTIGTVLFAGYLFFVRIRDANAGSNTSTSAQKESQEDLNPTPASRLEPASISLPPFAGPGESSVNGIYRLALINTTIPTRPRVDVAEYEVQAGDNLFAIADQYGLKPETVLWGNYDILQDNPQFLKPGQILNILPTDGVYYQWESGDTLSAVASFFEVETSGILEWPGNEFDIFATNHDEPPIEEGTWLIVPEGRRALRDWGPPAITRANPAAAKYYGSGYCGQIYEGAIGFGSFIWPTVSTRISGYDYDPNVHPGLDIAGPEGNSVFAADNGVVVFSGWSEYGYGYLIVLDHGNGWQTAYAHLANTAVTCGQSVARGTFIGPVGNTGNSTGPHLHFEMRSDIYGKVNPWNYVSP
jgi:murein DD-endopeptidase MepM/ murein hydrolase activator NlpD